MEWEIWKPWYEKIVRELNLDVNADEKAAELLNDLIPEPNIGEMENLVRGRRCVVLGAGPSLEKDICLLKRSGLFNETLIAADGATTAVMGHRVPDIIVTDLDGKVEDQINAWKRGALLVVHAHGDNVPALAKIVPMLNQRVLGTTQVKAFGRVFNFGGFTDGDRAAFMAHELGASVIYLAGMDLGSKIGRYSGDKDPSRKLVKLRICRDLLAWLAAGLGANMVNLTCGGESIPNVPREVLH